MIGRWAVLVVLGFAQLGVAGCVSPGQQHDMADGTRNGIEVLSVETARYTGMAADAALESACRQWRLTPAQVAEFFRLATRHDAIPYYGFYHVPCAIDGTLRTVNGEWSFSIGGGATAVWRSAGEVQHWGCSEAACEPLVLLPPDGLNPE